MQAPRAQYKKIDVHLIAHDIEESPNERTLQVKRADDVFMIILIYVDRYVVHQS